MATASILINGDPYPYQAEFEEEIDLTNDGDGDETTYLWEILDQPEGGTNPLFDETSDESYFYPTREGTYLIQLTVDAGLATESIDKKVVYIPQVKNEEMRIPAAGETTEFNDNRGWAQAVNRHLKQYDMFAGNPHKLTAVYWGEDKVEEPTVCVFIGIAQIKEGYEDEEDIIAVDKSSYAGQLIEWMPIGLMIGDSTYEDMYLEENMLCRVLTFGLCPHPILGSGSESSGDPIYVTNSGTLSTTPGDYTRCCGHVVETYTEGGDTYLWVFFTSYTQFVSGGGGGGF